MTDNTSKIIWHIETLAEDLCAKLIELRDSGEVSGVDILNELEDYSLSEFWVDWLLEEE